MKDAVSAEDCRFFKGSPSDASLKRLPSGEPLCERCGIRWGDRRHFGAWLPPPEPKEKAVAPPRATVVKKKS